MNNNNHYHVHQKHYNCSIKLQLNKDKRPKGIIDKKTPIFKGDGRKYVEDLVFVGEP